MLTGRHAAAAGWRGVPRGLVDWLTQRHGPGLRVHGEPWTRRTEPVSAPVYAMWCTERTTVRHVSDESATPVNRARFAEKPPLFPEINPRSSPVQTNFYLVLFLFIQVPEVSRNSKPGPDFI